ncbi:MAG: bifunctional molybdenum cofactor biosynthesis protein MoaC/MoaB [bacterium]|nr:bifunctional molybdenum cofactor biosynthesis protein MoaC/MoaB [bacterium]
MIDITGKIETLRLAVAESSVRAKASSIERVMRGETPKGEVLTVARAAGILAAKKTPEIIPYCHNLSLDHLDVVFEAEEGSIRITATAKTIGKTGVEMEALTAASFAALTIYDMMKGFDKEVIIGETRLIKKRGGKSDLKETFPVSKKAAVLVTSDSVSGGKKEDRSGKIIVEAMEAFPVEVQDYQIVPDDAEAIRTQILGWVEQGMELILTTGGTGLGPRDITVEVIRDLVEREVPGIAEAMRSFGQRRTPYAMLSRGVVGVLGNTLIITFPGSSKGVEESLAAIFPSVLHSFNMIRGGGH